MMRKFITSISLAVAFILAVPAAAFAHVVVTPAEAGVGSRTTFSVSVPNEKQVAVTGLRLTVPSGLESTMPTVHPGWTIATSSDGGGNVTEIRWEGGSIPAGQRDDFTFRAKLPAEKTELIWKAYQTYADGTTVAWDQKPAEEGHTDSEGSTSGPYSVTAVVDDLAATDGEGASALNASTTRTATWAFTISLIALVLSAVVFSQRRKPTSTSKSSKK